MRRQLRFLVGSFAFAASALAAERASALESSAQWSGDYDVKAVRRSDFTLGASFSVLGASAYGYPNEAQKIDDDRYVADPGPGIGTAYTIWLGGALRDWFTFGVGWTSLGYQAGDTTAAGAGVIFRIEAFPAFDAGKRWQDLGFYTSFGLAGLKLQRDGEDLADGGAMSVLALGGFYEPIRFSIFSFGPMLEAQHWFSHNAKLTGLSAGARLVLYTRP